MALNARAPQWLREVEQVDDAVYAAIAATPTPSLDTAMRRLSSAANQSRLWIAAAAALGACGGATGRRAAWTGLRSIAVTSAVVNLAVKPLARRQRPDRDLHDVPVTRHVRMPSSASFPSGHSASAFAFAGGVGRVSPGAGVPLHLLASAVAYSRVHTGVHFPGDTVLGSVVGTVVTQVATHRFENRRSGC
jgi:undecaprenyl-diphosphatase